MIWVLWAALLIAQNAAFTLVSRARNSNNIGYHAVASLLSNGVWFVSQFILINEMVQIIKTSDWMYGALVGIFYTAMTMTGSLGMHYIAMHKIEGRKVQVA